MSNLTIRQGEVLGFIKKHIKQYGFPPSRSEIAIHMGFSSANAAQDHLNALQRKGYVVVMPGISRGIKVIDKPYWGSA